MLNVLLVAFFAYCAVAIDEWWIKYPAVGWLVVLAIAATTSSSADAEIAAEIESLGEKIRKMAVYEDRRREYLDRFVVRVATLASDLVDDLNGYDEELAGRRAAEFNEAFNDWREEAERADPELA